MPKKKKKKKQKEKEVCCLLTLTYLVCTCQRSFLAGHHELTPQILSQGPLNADRVREAYTLSNAAIWYGLTTSCISISKLKKQNKCGTRPALSSFFPFCF